MVVLALVLLILVLLFSVAIVVSNPDVYQLSLFRMLVPVTSAGVFFTGFGAALVTIVALLLLRAGIRRSRETRRRLRAAKAPAIGGPGGTGGTAGSGPEQPAAGRSEEADSASSSEADPHRSSGRGATAVGSVEPSAAATDAPASGEAPPPGGSASRPPASARDLDPGEDLTTVARDQQTARGDDDDRDEPRA
jgi:hypothetical protein